ncbi:MAG: putative 4-mercaptohistidine N1-methyltransferase [Verrucomicrobia bacterium]|nr:MAG: putative 4-mercaptohistidine N1-methyltransferase [Verrucomicrobiota bacterium]
MSAPPHYESDQALAEYLLLHYGTAESLLNGLPGPHEAMEFPARVVRELLDTSRLPSSAKALDIGCAVGRSTFELARHCVEVHGIDSSQKFILAASTLAKEGKLEVPIPVEGAITVPFEAQVSGDIHRARVSFCVGDALNLPPKLGKFDVVLAANLICRLPQPKQFLESLTTLVGGQLLLTTPFTWLEEFRGSWLGATENCSSWEALKEILDPHFQLEEEKNLPFLIREHARKFQYGIALGSRWRPRA